MRKFLDIKNNCRVVCGGCVSLRSHEFSIGLTFNVYFVGDNYNPWVTGAHCNAKKCDGLLLRGVNIWLVLPRQTFCFTRSRREGKLNTGYHIASLLITKALKGFALYKYKVSEFGLKSRRVLSEKLATCSWLSSVHLYLWLLVIKQIYCDLLEMKTEMDKQEICALHFIWTAWGIFSLGFVIGLNLR